jgi:WD40 repeat protein
MSAGGSALILDNDTRQISKADFSPDGSRLCVAESEYAHRAGRLELVRNRARILDAGTGKECLALGEYRNSIDEIRFSPTGDRILLIDTGRGVILDATTGEVQRYLGEPGERLVHSAEFYPDGKRAVTGGSHGELRVWNLATGEWVARSTGQKRMINVVFSPDGSCFATFDLWVAQLWDAETCQPMATLSDGLESYAYYATFDALGDHLVIIYASGRAGVYPASFREFLRLAKVMVPAARKPVGMGDHAEPIG